jgi:dTDP-4-dehydrorhamnose 3,5-epimerase
MSSPAQPSSQIQGVFRIPFRTFGDDRGYFFESFRREWVPGAREMIQGNCSFSGAVRAALYDFRASSPTRGNREIVEMGDADRVGLYIPRGVAHGFYALKDSFMTYLVDEYYDNSDELGIRWDDPALGIGWGAVAPIVSERDQKNPIASAIPADRRPG